MLKLGVIVAIIFAFVLSLVSSYITAYNFGNKMEQQLDAEWTNNKNILAQYGLKIQEAVQVNSMYKDDLKDVVTSALQGRYGANGSQAVMQWIKEHNINFDAGLYKNIQQMIEAGRNRFENSQTKLIDTKRQYKTALGTFWQGLWLKIAGYPKRDIEKFNIVTSNKAEEAFEKGIEEPMKLR